MVTTDPENGTPVWPSGPAIAGTAVPMTQASGQAIDVHVAHASAPQAAALVRGSPFRR